MKVTLFMLLALTFPMLANAQADGNGTSASAQHSFKGYPCAKILEQDYIIQQYELRGIELSQRTKETITLEFIEAVKVCRQQEASSHFGTPGNPR